jgi:lipid II isoglutaminyl synthase (glutamine-hydrolysing)
VTVSHTAGGLSPRASAAVQVASTVNRLSRLLGRGSGTVIGGKAGLAVDPSLLGALSGQRPVVLVSGTNGKTTTTGMLVAALTGDGAGVPLRVATNQTGANMPAGHVAAFIGTREAAAAVLEVDEGYLGRLIEDTHPKVVVLLNLSRDQLDRIAEVRMLVDRWRTALGRLQPDDDTMVVANADDPMVVWAAMTAPRVRWVGAGQVWHEDAVGCPSCGGRIVFATSGQWHCDTCAFARPERFAWLEGHDLVLADGRRHVMELGLPGQFNRANAAMVVVAAGEMPALAGRGAVTVIEALERVAQLGEVAGRFSTVRRRGRDVRLLLAKNPAGWTAILDLLEESGSVSSPVVLSVNARVADGFDPSWLWDVPFERLAGRRVVATGERCRDLAVRLRYAEVTHTTVEDPVAAVDAAIGDADGSGPVEVLGNYTAFANLRGRL